MADQSITPSDVDWANKAAKRYADELAFRTIAQWARSKTDPVNILSLPADRWLWEANMADLFPDQTFVFFGVERDEVVHGRMTASAAAADGRRYDFRPCPQPEAAIDWIRREGAAVKLDMVYFDWMGSWSKSKASQLEQLFASDTLNKDSIFRFTAGLSRGKNASWEHLMDDVEKECFHIVDIRGGGSAIPEWRLYGVPKLAIDIAERWGRSMRLLSAHVYGGLRPNLGQSVPEISFTFSVA